GVGGILISAGTLLVSTVGTISLMRRWGRIALWVLALLPSVTLALLSAWFLELLPFAEFFREHAPSADPEPFGRYAEILIPAGTLLVSTVGTISTIWLAWRKERRDSREYTLKIQQLEMQLTELRATKTSSSTPPLAP